MSNVGLCWMKTCKVAGDELIVGDYRIVLCVAHRAELEAAKDSFGYSTADPPSDGSAWWPWEEL